MGLKPTSHYMVGHADSPSTARKLILLSIEFSGEPKLIYKFIEMSSSFGVEVLSHVVQKSPFTEFSKATFLLNVSDPKQNLPKLLSEVRNEKGVAKAEVMDAPISPGESRFIVFTVADLNSFFKLFKELGTGGQAMLYHLGMKVGQDLADRITAHCKDRLTALDHSLLYMESLGYGYFKIEEYVDQRRCRITIRDSMECSGHTAITSNSHLLRGLLAGILSRLWNKRVMAQEVRCMAKGDNQCEIVIKAE